MLPNGRQLSRLRFFVVAAFVAAAALPACEQNVDLTAVQATAATALSARDSFDALAGDYVATCRRRATYVTLQHLATAKPSPCTDEAQISKGWSAVNDGWFAYFEALSALAGSSNQTDYGFGAVAKDVDANATLKAAVPSADTVAKSLQDLGAAVFAARRRSAIADTVPKAVAYLTACARAQTDLAIAYRSSLDNERFELDRVDRLRSRMFLSERYAIEKDRLHDETAISDREAAADAYTAAVQTTLASQIALLNTIRSRRYDDLISLAIAYKSTFDSDIAPLGKAFK